MTDIDTLAATVRAGLDAEAEDAQRATPGPWWVEDRTSRFWGDVRDAEVASSKGVVATLPDHKGGHLNVDHIARQNPEATLARIARDRQLLDLLLAEPHHDWPGLSACAHARFPADPCTCGRDARVAAYLRLLAQPYTTEATE